MQTREFGKTGFQITPIGFGAWAIGGGEWAGGWGPQDDNESIAAIHRALELGVNWIDTAPAYGLGRSEEVVARALDGISDRPYVFTKCSIRWHSDRSTYNSMRADSIREEIENSLRRLRTETLDLVQIHWPNPETEIEEGWATLAELKNQGKIRHLGVSNFSVEQIKRIDNIAPVETLQPPYSLIKPRVEDELLPYCERQDIGVIVYSPMMSGLLTGAMTGERIRKLPDDDWRRNSDEFNEPRLSRNLGLVEKLREIGSRHDRSPGEVAIAWTLRLPAVTGAIVGGRRPEQVEGIVGGAEFRLSGEELAEIDAARSGQTRAVEG